MNSDDDVVDCLVDERVLRTFEFPLFSFLLSFSSILTPPLTLLAIFCILIWDEKEVVKGTIAIKRTTANTGSMAFIEDLNIFDCFV